MAELILDPVQDRQKRTFEMLELIDDRDGARCDIAFGDMDIHQQPSHGLHIARRGPGAAGLSSEPYDRQNRSRPFIIELSQGWTKRSIMLFRQSIGDSYQKSGSSAR